MERLPGGIRTSEGMRSARGYYRLLYADPNHGIVEVDSLATETRKEGAPLQMEATPLQIVHEDADRRHLVVRGSIASDPLPEKSRGGRNVADLDFEAPPVGRTMGGGRSSLDETPPSTAGAHLPKPTAEAAAPQTPPTVAPARADLVDAKAATAAKKIDKAMEAAEAAGKASAPSQLWGQYKVGPAFATRQEALVNLPHKTAHLAQVTHKGTDGTILRTWWEVSERGLPDQVGHTEQKALVRVNLKPGEMLEIRGYHPACAYRTGCQIVMEDTAIKTGADILYTGISKNGNIVEYEYRGHEGHQPKGRQPK